MSTLLTSAEVVPQLLDAEPEQVPLSARESFFRKSKQYTDAAGLTPDAFDELLTTTHDNGVTTWIARHDKTYATNGQSERLFYFVDTSADGVLIGTGEVRFALTDTSPYFRDKPFVGWVYTEPQYRGRRQGNLLGRLLVMREVTETRLGLPLYSDTLISSKECRMARKFVKAGLAEEVNENGTARFRSVFTPRAK